MLLSHHPVPIFKPAAEVVDALIDQDRILYVRCNELVSDQADQVCGTRDSRGRATASDIIRKANRLFFFFFFFENGNYSRAAALPTIIATWACGAEVLITGVG